jgi:hypothetical protein
MTSPSGVDPLVSSILASCSDSAAVELCTDLGPLTPAASAEELDVAREAD